MTSIKLYPGDNRESLRRLIDEGVRVHSVVTDPPYGLVSIQKRFGKDTAKAVRTENNDGSFARLSGGFMGKAWDGTGIERDPEFWKLIYDILLPGGYVFAFSGSRTGHWQACAMEMAGFVMHPMHGWCFGSGFPKAHAADKAIDKHLKVKGSYDGVKPGHEGFKGRSMSSVQSLKGTMGGEGGFARPWMDDAEAVDRYHSAYVPGSPEAAQWEGWAYGTQTQKPALEPIYLGQKPFSEKTGAANLLKHGVGAVNIDGCRVPTDEVITNHSRGAESAISKGKYGDSKAQETHQTAGQSLGRHPANLILDGSPEVVAMFPNSKGQQGALRGTEPSRTGDENTNCYGKYGPRPATPVRGDSGSAARFFHQFPPDLDPLIYHPKAGKEDRAGSRHPTVKPVALLQYLIRHITPQGGVILDPFAGSGTTAEAARREGFDCILMEAEPEYVEFIHGRFDLGDTGHSDALDLDLGSHSYKLEQDGNREDKTQSKYDLSDLLTVSKSVEPVAGADSEGLLV